jgi:hypothetical protein
MSRVDLAFKGLKPVTFLNSKREYRMCFGYLVKFNIREFGRCFTMRTQVSPKQPVTFPNRIGLDFHSLAHRAVEWLSGHIKTLATHIKFPAVIDACKPLALVTTKNHGRATMWASMVYQSDVSRGISKSYKILSQKSDTMRLTVFDNLASAKKWQPILPH